MPMVSPARQMVRQSGSPTEHPNPMAAPSPLRTKTKRLRLNHDAVDFSKEHSPNHFLRLAGAFLCSGASSCVHTGRCFSIASADFDETHGIGPIHQAKARQS